MSKHTHIAGILSTAALMALFFYCGIRMAQDLKVHVPSAGVYEVEAMHIQ